MDDSGVDDSGVDDPAADDAVGPTRVRAQIDVSALRHNLARVREFSSAKVMAVVKADAYGHGLLNVARALSAADAFGVAEMAEARALRAAGISQAICLFAGIRCAEELPMVAEQGIEPVIHHSEQVAWLERWQPVSPINIWIKLDSGMHRLGFAPEQIGEVMQRLRKCSAVGSISLMSHLANADDADDPVTRQQTEGLLQVEVAGPAARSPRRSLANSAGVVAWPDTHLDWVRPGIMLYGASPVGHQSAPDLGLKAVMRLCSNLISVRSLRRGDRVGYGGSWVCPEAMPVGVVACGYGDGYPRHAPSGTPVWVAGKRVALIGRVSMDLISVDLRACPEARVGSPVELWGDKLGVDEIAAAAGTIAYELLCQVTARVPRQVIDGQ